MTKKKSERGSLEFYLKQNYPVTVYPDSDGGFVAEIKDLPGCISQGETVEEVFAEIEDARTLWIETAFEHGDDIPLPSTETQYSGKTLLRMPRSLHQKLAEGSDREGVSLNQYIVSLLSEAIATKSVDPLREKIDAIYSSFCESKAIAWDCKNISLLSSKLEAKSRTLKCVMEHWAKKPANDDHSSFALIYLLTQMPIRDLSSIGQLEKLLSYKTELTQLIECEKVIEDKVQDLLKKTELDKEEVT